MSMSGDSGGCSSFVAFSAVVPEMSYQLRKPSEGLSVVEGIEAVEWADLKGTHRA